MNDKCRFVKYFAKYTDADGHQHYTVNTFDNVFRCVTYPSDFQLDTVDNKKKD